jgi:hypothetical protein
VRIPTSLLGWERVVPAGLRAREIRPIPTGSARFIVTIDGRPYAGFIDRDCAEDAIRLWCGEINGSGFPVPHEQRDVAGWPAVRGRSLDGIER